LQEGDATYPQVDPLKSADTFYNVISVLLGDAANPTEAFKEILTPILLLGSTVF